MALIGGSKLTGHNWSGTLFYTLDGSVNNHASGRVSGYSWYFQSTLHTWSIEIAEDPNIEENQLPLVGYGCGGWLYESAQDTQFNTLLENEADFITLINKELPLIFTLFSQNKLPYLPSVTCGCSD